jgi:hypothetical protein
MKHILMHYIHNVKDKDGYAVRAILPRPEGRGFSGFPVIARLFMGGVTSKRAGADLRLSGFTGTTGRISPCI